MDKAGGWPGTSVIDSAAGFAYFGIGRGGGGAIVKVRLSDLTRVAVLSVDPSEDRLESALIDSARGFAYFATAPYDKEGIVVKVRLSDFSRVESVVMNFGEQYLCCGVIDLPAGFAYFGATDYNGRFIAGSYPGVVLKVQIATSPVGPLDTMRLWAPYVGLAFVVAAVAVGTTILIDRRNCEKKAGPVLLP